MLTTAELPGPLITTDWLSANLDAADLRVIDCSVVMGATDDGGYTFVGSAQEWQSGHIPGSTFVDVPGELADEAHHLPMMMPACEHFTSVMERLGIGAGTRTILYDRSNHAWAARVWWMLRTHGYDDAAVLDGGWKKWMAEQRPISTEDPGYPEGRFEVNLRPELIATREQVLKAIKAADTTVINALSPEEHAGEAARFPRAGRIAGSVNVYCQSLVDPDTHEYLPEDKLREAFADAGVKPEGRTITYCGAGIAASSDALALTSLGYGNVAVYDGSLSEWTADPDLPMATG